MPNQTDKPKDVETEERKYLKPVAWLGGRDLLANLKYFLLFAAFKGKLDPRDWMTAEVFPAPKTKLEDLSGWQRDYVEDFKKSFREDPVTDEFWFDYFADSGDGMTAGYALAYLCLSDLQAKLPTSGSLSPADLAAGEIRSRLAKGDNLKQIAGDYRGTAAPEILRQLDSNANRDDLIKSIEDSTAGVVSISETGAALDGFTPLPRGAFLFVGGDTSYHVADFGGLGLRFQKVFQWAFQDLERVLGPAEAKRRYKQEENRRPIFGVPGNHDYYDMVDGFNRQFREPMTRETNLINLPGRGMRPQLQLPGFKRVQTATYVAIQLPFDWWFWGVDSELPRVDLRQQEFFRRVYAESNPQGAEKQVEEYLGGEPTPEQKQRLKRRLARYPYGDRWPVPRKLIVATSEPCTVEGRREPPDGKTPTAFYFLDLTRPFLYSGGPLFDDSRIRPREEELGLVDFECRLDISGDVHHYARYWGDEASGGHYASVVSGGGGASMSPTQTDYGEVAAQTLYPSKQASTRVVNKELFKPWVVIRGGNIWLLGFLMAIITYFVASFPEPHYDFTNSLVGTLLGIRGQIERLGFWDGLSQTVSSWVDQFRAAGAFPVFKLSLLMMTSCAAIIVAGGYARWLFERLTQTHDWVNDKLQNISHKLGREPDEAKASEENKPTQKEYRDFLSVIENQTSADIPKQRKAAFWGLFALSLVVTGLFWWAELNVTGAARLWWFLPLLGAVVFILAASWRYSHSLVKKFEESIAPEYDRPERHEFDSVKQLTVSPTHDYAPFWGLLILCVGTAGLAFYEYRYVRGELPLFGHSVLILFSIFVVIAAAIVAMYYSKWLFAQSYRIKVSAIFSYIPVTAVTVVASLIFAVAVWLFGRQQGRQIIADILFLIVLLGLPVGCVLLAVLVGNHVSKLSNQIVFIVMGVWHGILQLAVPFLIVWVGEWYVTPIVLALVLVVTLISVQLVKRKRLPRITRLINRKILVATWLLYGLVVLAIPLYLHRELSPIPPGPWTIAGLSLLAGLIGALMSCVWLGWYFATSLVFHGHTNEAGSTARTEHYKHFIRFKVTDQELTGYVIAVDFPHAPYAHLSLWKKIKGAIFGKPNDPGTGASLKPRLVDVFTLRCRPCPVTGKPLPRE